MSTIFITGTTSGIGAEMVTILSKNDKNTIVCGNRSTGNIALDMSSMKSIDNFIEAHKSKRFDIVILNAGTKATRKLVEWNGNHLNMCRVVNLVSNNYILMEMHKRNMLVPDAKIVLISSITHWNAVDNPNPHEEHVDPTNSTWANEQYSNTKLGLFFLGQKMKKMNPSYDIIIINPGMVATKIFGDKHDTGLITSTIRSVREFLSLEPAESANYIVKSILTDNVESKNFRYFTPYISPGIFGYSDKTQMLQDVIGKLVLPLCNSDTDNYSMKVHNKEIETNYIKYMLG